MVSALVAVELALRGHLFAGGGFAAGVAGGTAIGLLVISGSAAATEALYSRYRADIWEKVAVIGFCGALVVQPDRPWGYLPGHSAASSVGAWIPWLNVLVALKVTLGSWAILQLFVRYRGLL